MTRDFAPLSYLLAGEATTEVELEEINAADLKPAARFWFGPAANKFRKAESISALTTVFRDEARLRTGLRELKDDEREILAVFKRYGGELSGELLASELLARGLIEKEKPTDPYYSRWRERDPVHSLRAKLLLVSRSGRGYSRWDDHDYEDEERRYPDLRMPAAVLNLVEPAAPLAWTGTTTSPPNETSRRPTAAVAFDLWTIARAIGRTDGWKTLHGGSPAKTTRGLLKKILPPSGQDPLLPPDPEMFYYEILRGIDAIWVDGNEGSIDIAVVEEHLRSPSVVQGWRHVRAWIRSRLWQDGIGQVPERDGYDEPIRIDPDQLRIARELLVWALCRVAHGDGDWLDLQTFLTELWDATGEEGIHFYWSNYAWQPEFHLTRGKEKLSHKEGRLRAYWLDDEGTWAANAVMATLAHLGLVERGDPQRRPCFRLTAVGRAVFGAPEVTPEQPKEETKFLTVQPNHEVVAYLDNVDASAVWPLARIARPVSAEGGPVQTFVLTRDSMYQGLESGLRGEEVRRFLLDHSKSGLPDNVGQSLLEWGRRREALTQRTGVSLGAYPPGRTDLLPGTERGRVLGDSFVLLPNAAAPVARDVLVWDHSAQPKPTWRIDEEGLLRVPDTADSVSLARLSQFAVPVGDAWQITAGSVRAARDRGITPEQILGWLRDHLANELPTIIETAIRNWASSPSVFFGHLLMLQVTQPQACAMILTNRRFRPLLLGHLPPDWFVVRADKQPEMEALLAELGFSVGGVSKLAELPSVTVTPSAPASTGSRQRGRRDSR
jgi:hypothetical protein